MDEAGKAAESKGSRVLSPPATLSICIGSWNMGQAEPPSMDVWLPRNKFDLYIVGTQEGHPEATKFVRDHLTEGRKYVTVAKHTMGEISLVVMVRHSLACWITDVQVPLRCVVLCLVGAVCVTEAM